jgi:hypothetical protein
MADRPATTEIEITAAMIEAGAGVLLSVDGLDLGTGYAESVTRNVLVAALRAHRESFSADLSFPKRPVCVP